MFRAESFAEYSAPRLPFRARAYRTCSTPPAIGLKKRGSSGGRFAWTSAGWHGFGWQYVARFGPKKDPGDGSSIEVVAAFILNVF